MSQWPRPLCLPVAAWWMGVLPGTFCASLPKWRIVREGAGARQSQPARRQGLNGPFVPAAIGPLRLVSACKTTFFLRARGRADRGADEQEFTIRLVTAPHCNHVVAFLGEPAKLWLLVVASLFPCRSQQAYTGIKYMCYCF